MPVKSTKGTLQNAATSKESTPTVPNMESKSSHSLTKRRSWWKWQKVTCTAAPSRTVSINTDRGAANHANHTPSHTASHLTKNPSLLFKVTRHTKPTTNPATVPANMPNADKNTYADKDTFAEYKQQKATMAARFSWWHGDCCYVV